MPKPSSLNRKEKFARARTGGFMALFQPYRKRHKDIGLLKQLGMAFRSLTIYGNAPAEQQDQKTSGLKATSKKRSNKDPKQKQAIHLLKNATTAEEKLRVILDFGYVGGLQAHLESGADLSTRIDGKPLIFIALEKALDPSDNMLFYSNRVELLYTLMEHVSIFSKVKGQDIFDFVFENNATKYQILSKAREHLYARLLKENKQMDTQLQNLSFAFDESLFFLGLRQGFHGSFFEFEQAQIALPHDVNTAVAKALWNVCHGHLSEAATEKSHFNNVEVRQIILGLLDSTSPSMLISIMNNMWQHFGKQQKLVVNFIVKEMIVHVGLDGLKQDLFIESLRQLTALNHDDCTQPFNASLINLVNIISNTFNEVAIQNYQALHRWDFSTRHLQMQSLETALNAQNIRLVTSEIRQLSLFHFVRIQDNELHGRAWMKDDKAEIAPNICAMTESLNRLSVYLKQYILRSDNIESAAQKIELLINIADNLVNTDMGMDLNGVMTITSALTASSVSRLKTAFERLPKVSLQKYEQLQVLVSPEGNFRHLRQATLSHAGAIPFLGMFLGDLFVAYDSNKSYPVSQAKLMGHTFETINMMQKELAEQPIHFETDILNTLQHEPLCNEDQLHILSAALFPKLLFLNDCLEEKLETIRTWLDAGSIPRLSLDRKIYPSKNFLKPFLQWIELHSQAFKNNLKQEKLEKCLIEFCKAYKKQFPKLLLDTQSLLKLNLSVDAKTEIFNICFEKLGYMPQFVNDASPARRGSDPDEVDEDTEKVKNDSDTRTRALTAPQGSRNDNTK